MHMRWISAPHGRPRCRATDSQGRRCREPVVWDESTNRPVSTRCKAHGGLADAALVGRRSPDSTESSDGFRQVTGAVVIPAISPKRLPLAGLGRRSGSLPGLALAAALWLSMPGPAFADFVIAVAAYERGAYGEARTKFETLTDVDDERAEPCLEIIRQELKRGQQTVGSITTALGKAVASILGEPDRPSMAPDSTWVTADAGWFAAGRIAQDASANDPADRKPWKPYEPSAESAPPPGSDAIASRHESNRLHIFCPAGVRSPELIAGLVILRGPGGIGVGSVRFMRAATTIRNENHYG